MLTLALLLAGPAQAQQTCPIADFDNRKLSKQLYKVETLLRDSELEEAKSLLHQVGESIPCIHDIIDRKELGRFALAMSTTAFFLQDSVNTNRWGMLARLVSDPVPWPAHITNDHPLYELVEGLEVPPRGRSEGGFILDKGGAIFINGELALVPQAYAEVPALVQIYDGQATHVGTYWQDGAAFPAAILSPSNGKAQRPRWLGSDGAIDRDRAGPVVPLAPVAIGAGLGVISAISYAVAGSTAAGMGDLQTGKELTSARSTANALVLLSGVTAVGAVGVGVGGVLVSADGGRGVRFSFRF